MVFSVPFYFQSVSITKIGAPLTNNVADLWLCDLIHTIYIPYLGKMNEMIDCTGFLFGNDEM